MQRQSISIAERIEQFISKEAVSVLLQPRNVRAGMPAEKVSELAHRVLQGLTIIEEANRRLVNELLESRERVQMRENLSMMRKAVWEDVSRLRNMGLLDLGAG
jgi:hypothetical protein